MIDRAVLWVPHGLAILSISLKSGRGGGLGGRHAEDQGQKRATRRRNPRGSDGLGPPMTLDLILIITQWPRCLQVESEPARWITRDPAPRRPVSVLQSGASPQLQTIIAKQACGSLGISCSYFLPRNARNVDFLHGKKNDFETLENSLKIFLAVCQSIRTQLKAGSRPGWV